MKLLNIILLISGSYHVASQRNLGRIAEKNVNPDMIFFDDRPKTILHRPDRISGTERTTVLVQKSVEPQTTETDSYLQAALGAQNQNFGPFSVIPLVPNHNTSPVAGVNLQPPAFDNDNPNYYGGFSANKNPTFNQNGESDVRQPQLVIPTVAKVPHVTNTSHAVINFGLNILRSVHRRSGNLVFSPFSIAELLSLLQQGALGLTQQEISDALQMSPLVSKETFHKLNNNFKKRGSSHNILKVANNIFIADAFDLNPEFKTLAVRSYDSEVTPMRFSKSQEAVSQINRWVSNKTNDKITELLSEDAVGENTQVVLVNAVYFKGLWAVQFKPNATLPRDFYINEDTKKKTNFMRIRKIFRTGTDPSNHAQVVVLPFENEQYTLMVVMPSKVSSLDALTSTLTASKLASYNNFTPKEVDLEIPKFIARSDIDLNPVLRKMGVTAVFGPQSELSYLGTFRTYSPQLSSAAHSAMLSIDEQGGTASAATSFAVVALSYDDPSISFKVNRPFLAVLWDNEAALPLFMATVQDPTLTS